MPRIPSLAGCLCLAALACGGRSQLEIDDARGAGSGSGGASTGAMCPEAPWSVGFGSQVDIEQAYGVAVGRDCDVVVASVLRSSAVIAGEPAQAGIGLTRFHGDGTLVWHRSFGDADGNLATAVALLSDGGVVLAGHAWDPVDLGGGTLPAAGQWDVVVARYDRRGEHVWSKRFGDGDYQHVTAVAVDREDNVIVAGELSGTMDLGGGALVAQGLWDIFVAKLDRRGNHVFSRRFGDEESQLDPRVAVDDRGNIFVAGWFASTIDFGTGPLAAGDSEDVYVAKLDPTGAALYARSFGGPGSQRIGALAVSAAGNPIAGGSFDGAIELDVRYEALGDRDAFVVELTDSDMLWSRHFASEAAERVESLAVNEGGRIWLAGVTSGSLDSGIGLLAGRGGSDVFVAQLTSSGTTLRAAIYGDAESQHSPRIAARRNVVALAGAFEGSIDLPGGVLSSAGGSDAFLSIDRQ